MKGGFHQMVQIIVLLMALGMSAQANAADPPSEEDMLKRAKAGDLTAKHWLCYSYVYGKNGLKKDYEAAFKWCSVAAEGGATSSRTLLAEMYHRGRYVERDDEQAKKHYRIAAVGNHPHAQFMLGYLELNVEDPLAGSTFEACYWLQAAARQGYEKAVVFLRDLEKAWRKENGNDGPGYCDVFSKPSGVGEK